MQGIFHKLQKCTLSYIEYAPFSGWKSETDMAMINLRKIAFLDESLYTRRNAVNTTNLRHKKWIWGTNCLKKTSILSGFLTILHFQQEEIFHLLFDFNLFKFYLREFILLLFWEDVSVCNKLHQRFESTDSSI